MPDKRSPRKNLVYALMKLRGFMNCREKPQTSFGPNLSSLEKCAVVIKPC
jgi:hypothetical protein